MQDVQGRLQSLESMPVPPMQVSPPPPRPGARLRQNSEGLYSGLFIQPLLSWSRSLYLPTPLPPPENCVTQVTSREVRGSEVLLPWKGEWEGPCFPVLTSLCLKKHGAGGLIPAVGRARICQLFALGLWVSVVPQLGLLFPVLGFTPQNSALTSLPPSFDPQICLPLTPQRLPFLEPQLCAKHVAIISFDPHNNPMR